MFPFRISYLLSATGFDVPEGKAFQPGYPVQFGVGVSSRNFKKAVDRNRVKRLTREAWRLQKAALYETAVEKRLQLAVFLVFTGKKLPVYHDVYPAVGKCISKLQYLIKNEHEAGV